MEIPRAVVFTVTIRLIQTFKDLKFEEKRALLETKRITFLNNPLLDRPPGFNGLIFVEDFCNGGQ
ncbi:hypothetical protein PpBr36_03807 [Pyricularia pennisetigena]|uniref:hypothetical protein n=1 Tax=Pyricularia pennisetigena TaxID=1578925 RepID=UPI001152D6C8|nr:hypothetical protein PpBr36_03807 [Pyricularia pennisetigena]TLS30249.1 hypothetical protein PpBr36_03807 [Pyricularia pennisetigena]